MKIAAPFYIRMSASLAVLTLLLSAPLTANYDDSENMFADSTDVLEENPSADMQLGCKGNFINGGTSSNTAVFASYRLTQPTTAKPGLNLPFDVEDSNQGNGIVQDKTLQQFVIQKRGYYMINFGVQTASFDLLVGLNLVHTRNGVIQNSLSTIMNTSLSTILFLRPGDIISVSPQKIRALSFGAFSTFLNDLAFITFVRVKP